MTHESVAKPKDSLCGQLDPKNFNDQPQATQEQASAFLGLVSGIVLSRRSDEQLVAGVTFSELLTTPDGTRLRLTATPDKKTEGSQTSGDSVSVVLTRGSGEAREQVIVNFQNDPHRGPITTTLSGFRGAEERRGFTGGLKNPNEKVFTSHSLVPASGAMLDAITGIIGDPNQLSVVPKPQRLLGRMALWFGRQR